MDSLYLVMPAYNEEANIEEVVRAWYPVVADKGEASRMVIADSGSSDGTHNKLETLQKEFPKLEILSNTGKQHGPKVIALYRYAIERGADYIFQTDSDGQTNPAEFASFWKLRERYAGVFGFRKERGDGKIRAFVEQVVCLLLGLYFHVSVPDANAPFRLMRSEVVAKYLPRMAADYNLPNIMLTTFFSYYGERIRFRKISFKPRQAGVNSVNVRKIIGIGIKALGDFHAFKKAMLADETPAETLETWDPDAETEVSDDIPDMPKTVYVMKPLESAPEAESVSETQADAGTQSDAAETQADAGTQSDAAETQADAGTQSDAAETQADAGTQSDAAETQADAGTQSDAAETQADAGTQSDAAEENTDAGTQSDAAETQADAGTKSDATETQSDETELEPDAPEAEPVAQETPEAKTETRQKSKGVARRHPANGKGVHANRNGRHASRKVALKSRNGKES